MNRDVWLTPPMISQVSKMTKCHPRTVARWIQKREIPETPYALLDLIQNGRLDKIHNAWSGWRLCHRTGDLWTPTGEKMQPGHIMAMPYQRAMAQHYRRKERLLNDAEFTDNVTVEPTTNIAMR